MTLRLRIENYDRLDDGGPAALALDRRGASVGRARSMDWVLPDPARHISSHHFDIAFRDGAYWITDVSTNGTFLQGSRYRLEGPHRLTPGERLVVGHYIIAVEAAAPSPQPGLVQAPPTGGTWTGIGGEDPWDLGHGPLHPVNPLPDRAPRHLDDVGQDFVPVQRPPAQSPPGGLQQPPRVTPPPAPAPAPRPPDPGPPPQVAPVAVPQPTPAAVPMPPLEAQPPVRATAETHFPRSRPAAPGPTAPTADAAALLRAFCEGAGLDPSAADGLDPEAVARRLGQCTRIATDEVMRMLQDRASVKYFTKGGERTMRSATGNNPLKFLPDANQALEAMLLGGRDGFTHGPDAMQAALHDLRHHQMAVFAAIQPALAQLLSGLSPEEIEEVAEKGGGALLGGSRRARLWERYVAAWDAKAQTGENGMLDAFLQAFARAYAEATQRQG